MVHKLNKAQEKFLKEILKYSKDANLNTLINKMYSGIPYEDLKVFDIKYLFDCGKSAYDLLKGKGKKPYAVSYFCPKQEGEYAVLEVINNDVPFLVDSLCNELKLRQIDILLLSHSMVTVERDEKYNFKSIKADTGEREYVIQIHIENLLTDSAIEELVEKVKNILECINFAVADWRKMTQKMQIYCDFLRDAKLPDTDSMKSESVAFIEWLINNHLVFLGSVEVELDEKGNSKVVPNSKLGIANSQKYEVNDSHFNYELNNDEILIIRKWDRRSMVHRTAHLDTIIIKKYDSKNKCIGAALFFGLFTSTVYYQSVLNIPLMRQKAGKVIERYGYSETSHNCKELITVLESFPRGELLQMTVDQLYTVSTGIVALTFTPRIKVFARHDISSNFLSFLIFIPEKKFSTETRYLIEDMVCKYVDGAISKRYVFFGESSLVRFQLVVKLGSKKLSEKYVQNIEDKIVEALSVWGDELYKALNQHYPKKQAVLYHNRYKDAFEDKYKAFVSGKKAIHDIALLEEILESGQVKFDVYVRSSEQHMNGHIHLKIYSIDKELTLSSSLPMIENAGLYALEMQTFRIDIDLDGKKKHAFMQHYILDTKIPGVKVTEFICQQLSEVFHKVWSGEIENDEYNSLIIALQTDFRRANLFRAFVKYLKQTKYNLSTEFTHKALVDNRNLTVKLLNYFETKFHLESKKSRTNDLETIEADILNDLANIKGVSEDKALRSIFKLIQGILRTNFYQKDEKKEFKDYISIKVMSSNIEVPQPIPYAEIFVYARDFEAIHLRGGKVARGGLRWSDRREDFRTEVLGLMKAQMTKNSVIVPVGSKGGFVLKLDFAPHERQEMLKKGVECYKRFLSGILDITDNIISGVVVPPKDVIRYDGDDPYLVVAADKGTATFSNYANEVSESYGFWLGDAFASGGSAGYDHKKMGITAKGAWISVVRHFEEMGIDVNKDIFTVTGIGDMSGDVFGNGMLLSANMKLLAAFNHMHIFIDPDPDPKKSFLERKRLFEKPGSQWSDYNPKVLSKGGAVYERSQKSVKLSPEAVKALGLSKSEMTPDDLIRGILKANVHLLWNGGIGTYVKAKHEEDAKIGDKSNDSIRICGSELGAKVVGEGGNLGFTQLGRIEYARKGGRINTDFIDNSAGVDCSDHEVNIKIALADELRSGKLKRTNRDMLLEKMTDAVADLVLRDNFEQSQIITIEQQSKFNKINSHVWLINYLEDIKELDREIEFLPSREDLKKLIQEGDRLTRPEIAVLLAYSKNSALKMVTNTSMADDEYLDNFLLSYFPKDLTAKYDKILRKHILRKEIIATVLVNLYVNTLGITSFHQILDETGIDAAEIIKAFVATYEVFDIESLWKKIEQVEGHVPASLAITMINKIQMLIERNITWLIYNHRKISDLTKVIQQYKKGMHFLRDNLDKFITDEIRAEMKEDLERYAGFKAIIPVMQEVNNRRILKTSFDIITVANNTKSDLISTAKAFYSVGDKLSIRWLIGQARGFIPKQYLQILALRSLINEIHTVQMKLTEMELNLNKNPGKELILLKGKEEKFAKLERYIDELKAGDASEAFISKMTIALKYIKDFLV